MIKKNIFKKGFCLFMSGLVVISLIGCGKETPQSVINKENEEAALTAALNTQVQAGRSSESGKEETVYVLADANGSANQVIVSDWIKNATGSKDLADATDLKDIQNVKGYEEFKKGNNDEIIWQTEGSDIYYQGTTDKELPVEVKLSYTLDGKEMKPAELAGKSGKVTIRFDYVNKQKTKEKIGKEEQDVYVPFAMVSGMVLPGENFNNIEVTNAKLISEGSNNLIVGVAFPGLRDSLDFDRMIDDIQDQEKKEKAKELNIPEYIEVSADVKDFSLGMTMTMAMSDVLSNINLTDSIDLSNIDNSMTDLQTATKQLIDGSVELKDGTTSLKDGTATLADGSNKLANGATTLKDGTSELSSKSTELDQGAQSLKDGVATLDHGAQELLDGSQTLAAGTSSLVSGASQLDSGVNKLQSGLTRVDNAVSGLKAACEGPTGLVAGADKLAAGTAGMETLLTTYFDQYETSIMNMINAAQTSHLAAQNNLVEAQASLDEAISNRDAALQIMNEAAVPDTQEVEVVTSREVQEQSQDVVVATTINQIQESGGDTDEESDDDEESDNDEAGDGSDGTQTTSTTEYETQTIITEIPVVNTEITQFTTLSLDEFQDALTNYQNAQEQVDVSRAAVASAQAEVDSTAAQIASLTQFYAASGEFGNPASDPSGTISKATQGAYITYIEQTAAALSTGASQLDTGVNSVYGYLVQLNAADTGVPALVNGANTLKEGTGSAVSGAKALNEGATTLKNGITTLKSGTTELKDGTTTLKAGTERLVEGTSSLDEGAGTLKDGINTLNKGAQDLNEGAGALDEGTGTLEDGIVRFNQEGISQLTSLFGSDIETMVDRIDAVMDAGKNYNTFTKLPSDTTGTVRFIYKTEGI